ncbi:O-methyltransferase [Isachenkonia alkalipeptolytica]|uniref:tRNA 5-hydroxyuridine methyltransferase n=1 Tax=Isachenkonia alkalipeptolytica TaxID=2565777 RepID=A0AA43XK34_9CLOT|nr:O-methyltransferase [Isachenkonia alkalipeptolytica]NBG87639.1 O-methyltransferase [Isachenkonia alkalipeptolytica]
MNNKNHQPSIEEEEIVQQHVKDYIKELLPQHQGLLKELEDYAAAHHVPIIQGEVAALIQVLVKTSKAEKILEIGTAIGYSAMIMAEAMEEEGRIVTLERNEKMVALAGENIRRGGYENQIQIIPGDALETLHFLPGDYDLIFMDGGKGHYREMLDLAISLLKPGGLLISDNILYKGMVSSEELVQRRKRTIVHRMREYLEYITHHRELTTSIIPIGDGVALSYKKN